MTALTIGVGGFLAMAAPTRVHASDVPTPTASDLVLSMPGLASTPAASAPPATTASAEAVTVVSDQPFEATRAETAGIATDGIEVTTTLASIGAPGEGAVIAARAIAADAAPALNPGDQLRVPVSFYYCQVADQALAGDGGGFCGTMRDGSVVYPGAAACDVAYLGQHFRIEGDPLDRVYRCADTGSAVHGQHRDIWFSSSAEGWEWQRAIGQTATIVVLP